VDMNLATLNWTKGLLRVNRNLAVPKASPAVSAVLRITPRRGPSLSAHVPSIAWMAAEGRWCGPGAQVTRRRGSGRTQGRGYRAAVVLAGVQIAPRNAGCDIYPEQHRAEKHQELRIDTGMVRISSGAPRSMKMGTIASQWRYEKIRSSPERTA
jgi:hypothetical protein